MIQSRYVTLKSFHHALGNAGHKLSYKELSRQLSYSRFPNGPDEHLVKVIVNLCEPTEWDRIDILRRAAIGMALQDQASDSVALLDDQVDPQEPACPADSAGQIQVQDRKSTSSWTRLHTTGAVVVVAIMIIGLGVVLTADFSGIDQRETQEAHLTSSETPCPSKGGPTAFIVSGRSNSPSPVIFDRTRRLVQDATQVEAGNEGNSLSIVGLDGRPTMLVHERFTTHGKSEVRRAAEQGFFLDEFEAAVVATRAQVAEVDILSAFETASRTAKGGTVVLIDSALSTMPPMNFAANGLLAASSSEVVDQLRKLKRLPELQGTTVIFIGVGDVAEPQESLSAPQRNHLVDIWRDIVVAGGASCVEVVNTPRTGSAPPGVPPVRLVPVPVEAGLRAQPGQQVVLDDAVTGFLPDVADFRDVAAVRSALIPIAEWLRSDRSRRTELVGTTARTGPVAAQVQLSTLRAEAVGNILVELGVLSGQISVRGVGSEFPEYVNDVDAAGILLPGAAQANRTVRVTLR